MALKKYFEYARVSFLTILAFRARYYVGIVSYIVYIAIYHHIWQSIFDNQESVDQFSVSEITTYVAIGWISRSFHYNNLDRDIEQKVISGNLALDLLKPVDFQGMHYAKALGEGAFRFLLFSLPTLAVALVLFPITGPVSWGAAALFAVSTMMAALLITHVNFLVGLLAIIVKNIEGISYTKQNLINFLSGLLIPLEMLPAGVALGLQLLPFAHMSYTPLAIYLGKLEGTALCMSLALQAGWCVALFFITRWALARVTARMTIQGG